MGHLLDDEAGLSEEEKKRIEKLRVQFEATLEALKRSWIDKPSDREKELERKDRIRGIIAEINGIRTKHGLVLWVPELPDNV